MTTSSNPPAKAPRLRRLTTEQERAERVAAFAAIRALYCEAVPLWRACRRGFCRRNRRCCGDSQECLARGWPLMAPELKEIAVAQVLAGGPRRRPPASHNEWQLRRFPPSNFVHSRR